jgi:hypothetical protein
MELYGMRVRKFNTLMILTLADTYAKLQGETSLPLRASANPAEEDKGDEGAFPATAEHLQELITKIIPCQNLMKMHIPYAQRVQRAPRVVPKDLSMTPKNSRQ